MIGKLLDWLYDRKTERIARRAPGAMGLRLQMACDGDNPRYRDMLVRDAQIVAREIGRSGGEE